MNKEKTVSDLLCFLEWNPSDPDYPIMIRGAGSLNGIYCDLDELDECDAHILRSNVVDWSIRPVAHRSGNPDFTEVCLVIDL